MADLKRRLLGLKDLVCDAIDGTTQLVEDTQNQVGDATVGYLEKVEPLAEPARVANEARRVGTKVVCGSVRAVNHVVRKSIDGGASLAPAGPSERGAPLSSDQVTTPAFAADAVLGLVNGLIGDHLRERGNGLDMGMRLRFDDRFFEPCETAAVMGDAATPKLALFIHGLSATEASWSLYAEECWGSPDVTFATKLRDDLGYTPVFLRYNSGLHISENGRELSRLLDELLAHWPVPLVDLAIIGHSMGGLIARSATHYAAAHEVTDDGVRPGWLSKLRHVFTLGSPHLGSPLEKAGHAATSFLGAIPTPATQVVASVARRRSAAIKDLRHGYLVDEDWVGKDPDAWLSTPRTEVAFVDGVTYVFIGASITKDPEHPLGQLVGDFLVRLPSSTYEHVETQRSKFTIEKRVFGGLHHMNLQIRPEVYEQLKTWLAQHPRLDTESD